MAPRIVNRSNSFDTKDGSNAVSQVFVEKAIAEATQSLTEQFSKEFGLLEAKQQQLIGNFKQERIGIIELFSGVQLPAKTFWCDGSAVSRAEYKDLFSKIGTTFGPGNGRTTFNLPDFRGLYPRGAGSNGLLSKANGNPFTGGQVGEVQKDQIQGHIHPISPATSPSIYSTATTGGGSGAKVAGNVSIGNPTSDGTNGDPRVGDETRPASLSINFIIHY